MYELAVEQMMVEPQAQMRQRCLCTDLRQCWMKRVSSDQTLLYQTAFYEVSNFFTFCQKPGCVWTFSLR